MVLLKYFEHIVLLCDNDLLRMNRDPLFSVSTSSCYGEIRLCDLESILNHDCLNDNVRHYIP